MCLIVAVVAKKAGRCIFNDKYCSCVREGLSGNKEIGHVSLCEHVHHGPKWQSFALVRECTIVYLVVLVVHIISTHKNSKVECSWAKLTYYLQIHFVLGGMGPRLTEGKKPILQVAAEKHR